MRYNEKDTVLFKFHSAITDPNDFTIGEVITQLTQGLPEWKEPGEFYYIIKCGDNVGWVLNDTIQEQLRSLIGEVAFSKLVMGKSYWFVREKNIFGKWDEISKIPDIINFQLLRQKFK